MNLVTETLTMEAPVTTPAESMPVGTILHYSWGYDQTNASFYEVVGHTASGKSARLRKVAKETVPGSEGFMSCRVRPVAGSYVGEEFTKLIKFTTWRKTEVEPYCPFDYGCATPFAEGETAYSSWYA